MIQYFKIKNFLSIRDEVVLSFEATSDDHLEEYLVREVSPGVRLTKLGIIYGANASGKSNLVAAFDFLRKFWFDIKNSKDKPTEIVPFLLDNESRIQPSEFTLSCYIAGRKYIYHLNLTDAQVNSESLVYYPGTQPAELFTRKFEQNISEIRFGSTIKISKTAREEIQVKCLPNMSVLSAYNQVNVGIDELDQFKKWIQDQFLPPVLPSSNIEKFTEAQIFKNIDLKDFILKFLKEADFNISDIKVLTKEQVVPDKLIHLFLEEELTVEEQERLKKSKTIQVTEMKFIHSLRNEEGVTTEFELPDDFESSGTLRTLGLAGVIDIALKNNAFIAIDEIESSLHPKLIEYFIEMFIRNSESAQLLMTTHYDGLLEEEDLFRKDNIWFTNKKDDGSTELYGLSDFNGVNRISSLQKAYRYGKFGAVPNI